MFRLWKWYFHWKKNDFEKMCDEIAKCRKRQKCKFNPVICARAYVKKYIDGNEARKLQLKAEATSIKYSDFKGNMVAITSCGTAMLAAIVSIMSLVISAMKDVKIDFTVFKSCMFLAEFSLVSLFVFLVFLLISAIKFKNVSKWQKYIIVAIDKC